jgi:hypothetical protein
MCGSGAERRGRRGCGGPLAGAIRRTPVLELKVEELDVAARMVLKLKE